ncbi:MAG TPA: GntR family transcriptional regulator [Acetobacteraceae bacterium]|nr:GntR family transcriptional regulator [Acetobacteraceae bacterium]
MAGLVRSTLAEQAYRELRDRITRGELPPGHRLLPEELGQMLSISPTPVKEALLMLQRDGLIEVATRRFSQVRRFTHSDVAELYEARLMLERQAIEAGLAAGRVDDAFLEQLAAIAAGYAARSRRRSRADLREALRLDHALHTHLATLAGNALIIGWHGTILHQTQTARVYSLESWDAGNIARAQREHDAIVAALARRDREAALSTLADHLAHSRDNVLARLRDRGG